MNINGIQVQMHARVICRGCGHAEERTFPLEDLNAQRFTCPTCGPFMGPVCGCVSGCKCGQVVMRVICRGCGHAEERTFSFFEVNAQRFTCPSCGPLDVVVGDRMTPRGRRTRARNRARNGTLVATVRANPVSGC